MANGKTRERTEDVIPSYIKDWREALCLTQPEVGYKMGHHHTYVLKKEKEQREIRLNEILLFANAYQIPWQMLLIKPPDEFKKLYQTLNSEQRCQVLSIFRSIYESDVLLPPAKSAHKQD